MSRLAKESLLALVQSFFCAYLRRTRGASEHTVRAYRDALRMLFLFLSDRGGRPVSELQLDDVQADAVLSFLDHLESARGNGAVTRNCRLAAIRSFADHLLRHDPTRAEQYGRILAIPTKRAANRLVSYLEPEDVRVVLAAVEGHDALQRRDRALLLFLYNTGARVSEALAMRSRDLQLQRPRQVRLFGKGRKERICPLWAETATALREIPLDANPDTLVFRNAHGAPLTRDGAAYIVEKYVGRAAQTRPTLRQHGRVTPHVLRHSCAVALLQAGVDICVIRDYLGHASVATTSRYVTTNLKTKRDVLESFWKRAGLDRQPRSRWRPSSSLLSFLSSL
jgi:site-specific recombinase XerD